MAIKYCMMPKCWNNSACKPNKLFIRIPVDFQTKESWFKAMNLSPSPSIKNTCQFCCEDHFDLMNDTENFIEFKLIGSRLRMKKNVVPHLNINRNKRTAEESQFTLSAQQIRNTNIETLQQCPFPPKKVMFNANSPFTISPSMSISTAYPEPEIDFNINKDNENVLLSLANQETEENFANYITVKKEFVALEACVDQEKQENQEKPNEYLPLVKQNTDESFEDGVTIKKEYIPPEDYGKENEQLVKQNTDQYINSEEKNKNVCLSLIKQETNKSFEDGDTINIEFIAPENCVNEDEQLIKQKTNQYFNIKQKNKNVCLPLVKQKTNESFEDGVTNNDEYFTPEDCVNEDEPLVKQKTDQYFNIKENNKNLLFVKQETDESFEDSVTINVEFIAPEDCVNEHELENQKTDQYFNIKENSKNVFASLVKQETDESSEDSVTINVEFIAPEDCVNKEAQLVKQKTVLDFNSKEQNKDVFFVQVKQEIEESFEDGVLINEEFITPEDEQLVKQKKDLGFNIKEENKNEFLSLVKTEKNESLEDCEFIASEDCIPEEEQLIKQENDTNLNNEEANKIVLLSSVKQETEEYFENDVTMQEFIASEDCIDQDEQLIYHEIDIGFNIKEENHSEEIEENSEENITIKEECIAPEDYVHEEFDQELETHELILNITDEHNYYGEKANINLDIREEIEPNVDQELDLNTEHHVEVLRPGEEVCGPDITIQDVVGNQVSKRKRKLKIRTERRVECSICKKYLPAKTIKYHMRVHTGIKDFKCTICNKQFIHKSDFQEHSYKTHLTVQKVIRRYACSYCNKMFPRLQLESHIKITHLDIKNYECNICNQKFKQMSVLNAHIDKHNGVKIQCTNCDKKFSRYYINNHKIKCRVTNFEI